MSSAKNYAKSVLDGFNETIMRLAQRYSAAVSAIDTEHDAIKSEINKKAQKDKSMADMSGRVSLNNTQSRLLDKGLSRSGASVQAELDSNLARNTAFSEIESNASRERSDNETARAKSKTSALAEFINAINSAEIRKNEAYIAQLNADRNYEADRDDEMYDRYADERDYTASRDDEKHNRYVENRAYEAERDDEKFDRYAENRAYEAERDDEKFDRYAENRAYEAERDDEKFDRYVENRAYEADRDDEKFDRYTENRAYSANRSDEMYDRYADARDYAASRDDEKHSRYVDARDYEAERDDEMYQRELEALGELEEESKVTSVKKGDVNASDVNPKIAPRSLVDKINHIYIMKEYEEGREQYRRFDLRNAIKKIVNDETLTPSYRYEVKIYAEALGIYF